MITTILMVGMLASPKGQEPKSVYAKHVIEQGVLGDMESARKEMKEAFPLFDDWYLYEKYMIFFKAGIHNVIQHRMLDDECDVV